ncbi:MAG: alpha/beta family hydrolase [Quisquiliibacterium sp.]
MLKLIASLIAYWAIQQPALAQIPPGQIGVVVMHGKGGSPYKFVNGYAATLEQAGYKVANLEMTWSRKRQYDVSIQDSIAEVTKVFNQMRAQGVTKVFVTGQSQGAAFAAVYAGQVKVDGLVLIAPGGMVDTRSFVNKLEADRREAQALIDQGKGDEVGSFNDFEGSKGTFKRTTTARIYLDWFNPEGQLTTAAFAKVLAGTATLYVAPTRDYRGLQMGKQRWFASLPAHPLTRLYEPDADHLHSPDAAAPEVVTWIAQVANQN